MIAKPKRPTLYKRVAFLTVLAVFVSLLTEYILIFTITDSFNVQKKETSALLTAATLAEMPELQHAISQENTENEQIITLIKALSAATISNIMIFDMHEHILFESIQVPEENFSERAKELVFSQRGGIVEEYELRNKSYYSNTVTKKIFNTENKQIGAVVVAELSSALEVQQSYENLFLIFLANAVGLLVGLGGSMFLAKNIKDTLFGLEPEAIAKQLEERSAMLNSVQEGILCVNQQGIITLVNSSAKKIFEYAGLKNADPVGLYIEEVYRSDMKEVLVDGVAHINYEEKINRIPVLTNQLPIKMEDKIVGAITTFRLKTEMEELAEQLTGVKAYADALRAQTHEFMNKMHVILGLTELEKYDELREYIKAVASNRQDEVRYINQRLHDPVLSGFVLGKISRARELDIDFSLTEESYLPEAIAQSYIDKIISIIGNLINNAFEALEYYNNERIVLLSVLEFEDDLIITVEDSAQGIEQENLNKLFTKGFSSKGLNRGFGLYLVQQALEEIGGTIEVETKVGEGTIFTVRLPYIKR